MRQVAALPYRHVDGFARRIEVLLVTNSSNRWIIPKGDIDGGMAPHRAAEKEAFEEGGVRGHISDQRIGTFRTRKRLYGVAIPTRVDVFPLEVTEELQRWPEMEQRERRWLALDEAAETVREPELREIISAFRP
jgi:ADP-ribose pyrophosphatase YjhB (NUDIX family)